MRLAPNICWCVLSYDTKMPLLPGSTMNPQTRWWFGDDQRAFYFPGRCQLSLQLGNNTFMIIKPIYARDTSLTRFSLHCGEYCSGHGSNIYQLAVLFSLKHCTYIQQDDIFLNSRQTKKHLQQSPDCRLVLQLTPVVIILLSINKRQILTRK
jgi:hypothetical protein